MGRGAIGATVGNTYRVEEVLPENCGLDGKHDYR
jgi:hypothetical protein